MKVDLYILAFSAVTVLVTIWMGFRSAKKSKTASDFFVAGRSVGVGMNASAISGEYLSAASFMGIAGMVMSSGYDALWYPVCYACGYLFLLLFIAGPLRRFGAYTIPDFAEGRFDSPVFRKIAVVFVLFIGFFYTMPQMKGAGTTLAYIFPGLPYWAGVVLVGAVITLNVALGGMKGITLVQAFQYWAKMFAISVPIFVLMAVYGHYGNQLKQNNRPLGKSLRIIPARDALPAVQPNASAGPVPAVPELLRQYARKSGALFFLESSITNPWTTSGQQIAPTDTVSAATIESSLAQHGIRILHARNENIAVPGARFEEFKTAYETAGLAGLTKTEVPNRFNFRRTGITAERSSQSSQTVWRKLVTGVQAWFRPDTNIIRNLPANLPQMRQIGAYLSSLSVATKKPMWVDPALNDTKYADDRYYNLNITLTNPTARGVEQQLVGEFEKRGVAFIWINEGILAVPAEKARYFRSLYEQEGMYPFSTNQISGRIPLPPKAPADATWLNPFGPLTTKAAKNAAAAIGKKAAASAHLITTPDVNYLMVYENSKTNSPTPFWKPLLRNLLGHKTASRLGIAVLDSVQMNGSPVPVAAVLHFYGTFSGKTIYCDERMIQSTVSFPSNRLVGEEFLRTARAVLETNSLVLISESKSEVHFATTNYDEFVDAQVASAIESVRRTGRFTPRGVGFPHGGIIGATIARTPPRVERKQGALIPLRPGLSPEQRMTVNLESLTVAHALGIYAELIGRQLLPNTNSLAERADDLLGGKLSQLKLVARVRVPDSGVREHGDGAFTASEVKAEIEASLRTNGIALVAVGDKSFAVQRTPGILPGPGAGQTSAAEYSTPSTRQDAGGTLGAAAEKAWLAKHEKPLALLYTYSLIIAIVCGTAGLPHILVRFYTNPDGTAAKKTTMWVMILIGIFYVFPPVFGVIGRNLLPDLYNGVGAKGTDKIVLELPRILNEKYPPLGSILSGITCAGAFAAFMSTFSGLLVSMTGALAHDVYGRILRPKATAEQRMRMFKIGAVLLGGVAVLLGSFVEPLEINFMVGQAFAIAAASYFPLLFMAVWWRKLTMKGAAVGMLTGGVCALMAAALTNFSNLALDKGPMGKVFAAFAPLNGYWAEHPLLRTLCEQPAIWAVPLAITLMIVVSKLTAKTIPSDSRMKMLVLHAPEQLGLKQEYIQEHQIGH